MEKTDKQSKPKNAYIAAPRDDFQKAPPWRGARPSAIDPGPRSMAKSRRQGQVEVARVTSLFMGWSLKDLTRQAHKLLKENV
jgi:hypothetical protein